MDGHWEWSEGDDAADTADLGGDGGGPADFGADYGFEHTDLGGDLGHDLGGEHHDLGHDLGGEHHDPHDLEEPLGTEHAAADYDHAVETGYGADDVPEPDVHTDHTGDTGDTGDTADDAVGDTVEEPVTFGVDPDVDTGADDPAWHDVPFPAELHLEDPPEPVDGFPWTDVDVIGGGHETQEAHFEPAVSGPADPAGLADYDGAGVPDGADPWSLLLGSDDPATSSLATFWAPQS
ncbi:hypothetical protein ABZS66_59920 [Dactylosporangium sp. NPDC005572]|uniref:hypothetical protein n=1 Tax=Dactylosporangium sp. NPDC005572 TaxID=3156889 RepID=UPI0033A0669F